MEEETVAIDDILSKIPDHIIHCILSFLPSVKDVVRTSAISKSWHQAWLTFPIPRFDFPYSIQERFIENTLQRFGRQNGNGMKIFNLFTNNKIAHHNTTRWIGMALDIKVEHLTLNILNDSSQPPRSQLPCFIPDRVLSAYWLKSLKLVGPAICIQSSTEGSLVDLRSLKSLRIEFSYYINNDQLQKLLSNCPALEDIALLYCDSLSKVDIFDHPNLETLKFSVRYTTRADRHIEIGVIAPKLKSFSYDSCDNGWLCDVVVNIQNSPELKSLSISYETKTDKWFHKFIAQFPLLENLTINYCNALKKIRISNPLLEEITIRHSHKLEDMVISSKKLTSFYLYTMDSSIPNPSIRMEMDNPPNNCTANINNLFHFWCSHLMETSWYCKLKEFLTRTFTFKSLKISIVAIYAEGGDMNGEDVHKKLPHAACNIEKLSMYVNVPSSCHPHMLNGLLSICYPTTIELDVTRDNLFCKFICKEFENRGNNKKCYCKDDFKCWKHQLKEVKIKGITGIELEGDLEWDALLDLLPTLMFGDIISFSLMW